jgi:hypothetical protein
MLWLLPFLVMAQADAAPLRMNDLSAVGTHNSYKLPMPAERMEELRRVDPDAAIALDYGHRPLVEQLDAGARQLELDIYQDPHGGRFAGASVDPRMHQPGFKVLHIPGLDDQSSCVTFVQCLTIIRNWSDDHPQHVPILILLNAKDAASEIEAKAGEMPLSEAAFDALDLEIRGVLPPAKLIVPDDVQGRYPTLREAVLANNWPTLDEARGRFMFALDEGPEKVALYRGAHTSLEGRVMFVNAPEDSPAAAYLTLNHPLRDAERIARAVRAGFIVRTRADEGTLAARTNDTRQREAALASGAQYVSTDYLWPDPRFGTSYRVALPGGGPARCNPIRRVTSADWDG